MYLSSVNHYDRLYYEDKGCSNMDSAGINLPLVGLIIIKTQYHHTKENWKTNLSYCVLSKYPHLCSPILVSFLGFKVIRMLNVIRITQLTDPESILAGWANVHGDTGVFHEAPIFAVAIGLNSHGKCICLKTCCCRAYPPVGFSSIRLRQ